MTDKEIEDVADALAGPPVDSHVRRAYLADEFRELVAVDDETRTRMWKAIEQRSAERWAIEHAGSTNLPRRFERSDLPAYIGFAFAAVVIVSALCGGAS